MKEYKDLAGQTLVYGLGTIVPRLLNYLLLTPFYTRIFLQNEYGVIIELYSYVAFLMVLLTYGMETTYFRFSSGNENKNVVYNNALGSLLLSSLLFIIIIGFFQNNIASLIGYVHQPKYILWFSFIVTFDAITAVSFAKLRNENKAYKFAFIKIGNILINIGFNIFFFLICKNSTNEILSSFYKPEIGVGYAFLSNLFASLFNVVALYKEFFSLRFKFNVRLLKEMFSYAWPLLIIGIAGMFNEVADKILLKYLSADNLDSMKEVGVYGANYKLAILMSIFIQMFKYAAEPFFFKKSADSDAKKVYGNVMNYFIIFCLFIFLLVTLYIDIFKYFIGEKFRDGLFIVPIILFANMFLGIFYNLSVWYKINNRTLSGAIIAIIGVFITVVLNFIFIPRIGYLGSAWATFFCYLVMVLISYFWGRQVYKINYPLKKILIYNVLAIFLFFIYKYIGIFGSTINFIISTVLLLIYILAIVIIEKINFNTIKNIIKA
ncbi:MAG: polysaccharide biosynthesis C-terminal domain-containing protein [Salinivirgaceae bacterium]|nr:polysaccharide biosynthesis C-terminal domain-containing protein [Salinivirgaceae bacterium]